MDSDPAGPSFLALAKKACGFSALGGVAVSWVVDDGLIRGCLTTLERADIRNFSLGKRVSEVGECFRIDFKMICFPLSRNQHSCPATGKVWP